MDVAKVAILVSPSHTSISSINDNYCLGPSPVHVNQSQLDQLKVQKIMFSKTVDPISCQTVKLDVSYNVVSHVHSVPLYGPPQRKGVSLDQSVSKIKHVKGVCCVNPCLSVPSVTNVPNVVPEQNVGGRLQKFWQVWLDLGANPRVVSILKEGYTYSSLQAKTPFNKVPLDSKWLCKSNQKHVPQRRCRKSHEQVGSGKGGYQVVPGLLQLPFPGSQTQQEMETNFGFESPQFVPQYGYL